MKTLTAVFKESTKYSICTDECCDKAYISERYVLDCFAVLIEQIKSLFTRTLQFGPRVTSVFS